MRVFGFLGFCLAACAPIFAAPIKVWVELRDKGPGLPSNGRTFEDAPVYAPYLAQLQRIGFAADVRLKWQNRVSGWIEPADTVILARQAMVRRVRILPRKAPRPVSGRNFPRALPKSGSAGDYGVFQSVFDALGASALRAALPANTAGRGIRVAIIDQDFNLGHSAFAHLWQPGRIADQWDFVGNRPVAAYNALSRSHGAAVLSLVGAKSGEFEGLVPEADFLLYRAEDEFNELYVEEDYVAAALERAVDSGAQVINISLGYRYGYTDGSPDLPYAEFDGRTRPSSVAALMAARRGVVVSIAMGNEGQNPGSLGAPADADSVLSVGIVDAAANPCGYASAGPTVDGRIKPELVTRTQFCATATADPAADSGAISQSGTSFAAPVVAGIAALLRQLHPGASAEDLRLALMFSADNASRPNPASGYGLVRAWDAHRLLRIRPEYRIHAEQGLVLLGPNRRRAAVSWRPWLDPAAAQIWDLRGRNLPAKGGSSAAAHWIEGGSPAMGVFIWRFPAK